MGRQGDGVTGHRQAGDGCDEGLVAVSLHPRAGL